MVAPVENRNDRRQGRADIRSRRPCHPLRRDWPTSPFSATLSNTRPRCQTGMWTMLVDYFGTSAISIREVRAAPGTELCIGRYLGTAGSTEDVWWQRLRKNRGRSCAGPPSAHMTILLLVLKGVIVLFAPIRVIRIPSGQALTRLYCSQGETAYTGKEGKNHAHIEHACR